MKTNGIIIIILLIFTFPLISFSQNDSMAKVISSTEAQKNQAADDVFLKALQTGDVNGLDSIISPEFVNHGVGEKVGIDSLKASIQMFYLRFKPTKAEVKTRIANGEYFGDWIRYSSGSSAMIFEGIEMTRYSNGKAVEHWFFPGNQIRR